MSQSIIQLTADGTGTDTVLVVAVVLRDGAYSATAVARA
jgi:hypothetical protein